MMLQINLLPGSKKTTRGAGSLAGSLGASGASIRDPWLVGAAGAVVVARAPRGNSEGSKVAGVAPAVEGGAVGRGGAHRPRAVPLLAK